MRAAVRAWGAAFSHARRFSATPTPPAAPSKVGPLFFGTMVVTTLGLGTWQLSRHGWKKDLIETRKADLEKGIADVTVTPCVCEIGSIQWLAQPRPSSHRITFHPCG